MRLFSKKIVEFFSKKAVFLSAVPLLILSIGMMSASYMGEQEARRIETHMASVLQTFVHRVDPERFASITSTPADNDNEDYKLLRDQLIEMGRANRDVGVRWIYTVVPKNGNIIFSIDSIEDENHSEPGDVYKDASPDFVQAVNHAWTTGKASIADVKPYTDQWGTFISLLAPIRNLQDTKTLAVMVIDVDYVAFFQNKISQVKRAPYAVSVGLVVLFFIFTIIGARPRKFFLWFMVGTLVLLSVWNFVFVPRLLRLSDTFSYQANVVSKNRFYNAVTKRFENEVALPGIFSYEAVTKRNNVLTVRNMFDVRGVDGGKLFSTEHNYGIHALTGEHIAGYGDIDRVGTLFAPRWVRQRDFFFWHAQYDEPAHMVFSGYDTISGLAVQRYDGDLVSDQSKQLTFLTGVPEKRKVVAHAHVTLWVEPVSGWLVKYQDDTEMDFVEVKTGAVIVPWDRFTTNYTEQSFVNQARLAHDEKIKTVFVQIGVPIIMLVFILLITLIFYRRTARLSSHYLVIALVCVIVMISIGAFIFVRELVNQSVKNRFEVHVQDIINSTKRRFDFAEDFLFDTRAYIETCSVVDQETWQKYVERTGLLKRETGLLMIGLLSRVGDTFPVRVVEPYDVNKDDVGFDMSSDATRNSALQSARDSGQPVVTGVVHLTQNGKTFPGFLLVLPMYRHGALLDTVTARREELVGFVYEGFDIENFMQQVSTIGDLERGVTFTLHDSDRSNSEKIIYDGNQPLVQAGVTPQLQSSRKIMVTNRTWHFDFAGSDEFVGDDFSLIVPYVVLAIGMLLAIAVFIILRQASATEARATKLAENMTGYLVEKRDELLKAEDALRTTNLTLQEKAFELEKYRLAVENANEHVVITDADGVILYANRAAERTTGYTLEEMHWKKPSLWGKQMPAEFYQKLWHTIKDEKKNVVGEVINKRKDGTIYTASFNISPILDAQGNVKFFVALERDITAEKEAQARIEIEVREKTKEVREEKSRLLASINSLSFGFLIINEDGNIMLSNPSILKILDTVTVPKTITEIARYFDTFNLIEECKKYKDALSVVELKDVPFGKKVLRIFCAPIVSEQEVIGHVMIFEDVTEAKVLERSRDEFFAVASHELRTPLTAIRGNAELILDMFTDNKPITKEAREMLGDIDEASVRLIGIVEDFLEASRLEQGKIVMEKVHFDPIDLVGTVVKSLHSEAQKKKVSLEVKPCVGATPKVVGDKNKVEQILVNLIGNAIKFTKDGTITVAPSCTPDVFTVRVVDTGVGISAQNQNLLFRKFQPAGEQMLARDVSKSSGLGLYISKLLAERMGGSVRLEDSVLGKGSTFIFTLPINM